MDAQGRILQGFGAAFLAAAIVVLVISVGWPDMPLHVYGLAILISVLAGCGLTWVVNLPADVLTTWAEKRHERAMYQHAEDMAGVELRKAQRELSVPPVAGGQGPVIEHGAVATRNTEAWRAWLLKALEKAKTLGGIHYTKCMDAVMEYEVWKNQFHRMLFVMGMSGTVTGGQRTNLTAGLTIEAAMEVVKAWKVLPCPDIPPPHFQDEPHTEGDKGEEMPGKGAF